MRLSDENRGMRWLSNFAEPDRDAARLLLDSLRIAPSSEMRIGLNGLLNGLATSGHIANPAVLIPVLSGEDILPKKSPGTKHVAYETFQPGDRISATPGSEGWIGNLVREQIGSKDATGKNIWLGPRSSLKVLRKEQCRTVVVLTDYCGSGNQVVNFAESFARNKTIRSWRSLHWISIHVVAFAISPQAATLFENTPCIDRYWSVETARCFANAEWSPTTLVSIVDICNRYASAGSKFSPLGYGGSGGLFVMDTGAPNNLPSILLQKGKHWDHYFNKRKVPVDVFAAIGSLRPKSEPKTMLLDMGQSRLAKRAEARPFRSGDEKVALVLGLLSRRRWSISKISTHLDLPGHVAIEIIEFLNKTKLIDDKCSLTAQGWAELAALRRLPRSNTAHLVGSDDQYYPKTLR